MALQHHYSSSDSNAFNQNHGPAARLLPELRHALARLYSLPAPAGESSNVTVDEAHEFLIYFQSRNLKRKLQSWQQRQRDLQKKDVSAEVSPLIHFQQEQLDWKWGSTWYACWMVLAYSTATTTSNIHSTERLFCAQTLVHRLQRTKLVEAIDIEMEFFDADSTDSVLSFSPSLLSKLQFNGMHPLIAYFLQGWGANVSNCNVTSEEETWKGQLTLTVLSAILYLEIVASDHTDYQYQSHQRHNSQQQGQPLKTVDNPLLSTLASAVALTALRLQYSAPLVGANTPKNNERQLSGMGIVSRISLALEQVIQVAATNMPQHQATDKTQLTLLYTICLGAIPDAIWTEGVGNSGTGTEQSSRAPRISMDPNVLSLARQELRQAGIQQVWDILSPHVNYHQPQDAHRYQYTVLRILSSLKQWAEVMPLPMVIIEATVPGVNSILLSSEVVALETDRPLDALQWTHLIGQIQAEVTYLTAIFEISAVSWNELLEDYKNQYVQQNALGQDRRRRKTTKQSSDGLDASFEDEWISQAQAEYQQRGDTACRAALFSWPGLRAVVQRTLQLLHKVAGGVTQDYDILVASTAGSGPIGCLVAAAHACLPFLLAQRSSNLSESTNILESFVAISVEFQKVCSCPSRTIRSLTYEPLLDLHKALLGRCSQPLGLDHEMEKAVVDHLANCCTNLASCCGYPPTYFATPDAPSDEELEVERNDVRDVLRTVAGSDSGSSTSTVKNQLIPPSPSSVRVLHQLVLTCWTALTTGQPQRSPLDGETAIHVLSALAKPLNHLAATFLRLEQQCSSLAFEILFRACQTLGVAGERLIEGFASTPVIDLFPISRVANLATASLAPMLSALIDTSSRPDFDPSKNTELKQLAMTTLQHVTSASALSLLHIPELLAESDAHGIHFYDARAAMRAPGGEDHVGSLALMRLSFESHLLARSMIERQPTILLHLCQLHERLKQLEQERERGKLHGKGVTPKTRRILLKTIAYLDGMAAAENNSLSVMHELFQHSIALIVQIGQAHSYSTPDEMYRLCEVTFDIAEFARTEVSSLFYKAGGDSGSAEAKCIETCRNAGLAGYNITSTHSELQFEWSRFRAALFMLVRNSPSDDLAPAAIDLVVTLIQCECEAIVHQCNLGPTSQSSLFCQNAISEEHVPAGVFVKLLGDLLIQCRSGHGCVRAVYEAASYVLLAVLHECPQPTTRGAFEDPRPTILEAWLYVMVCLMKWIKTADPTATGGARQLLLESGVACLSLLFFPNVKKPNEPKTQGPGMSLDGPHSRAIMEFFENYFQLGSDLLQETAVSLASRLHLPQEYHNIGIIGSALFRGVQGALPPWTVEYLPGVYASLFHSFGKDHLIFGQFMQASVNARLPSSAKQFGSVLPGMLLSGPCFEGVSERQTQTFVEQAAELARCDSLSGWKRMKGLVKQACGGKKKEADFQQKPPPTNWEFDRI